jgi:hypothetical protein
MKKLVLVMVMLTSAVAAAQNWTTVTASNITDLNQQKLAVGQLCFLGTDQNDTAISFNVGGGGQVLKRAFCAPVSNGAVTSFTVPNPATTTPAGVYYRVTVKDVNSGQEVLRYNQVSFTGTTFNFDSYAPLPLGQFAPLTGTAVSGNLSVNGNLSITGSFSGANFGLLGVNGLGINGATANLNAVNGPSGWTIQAGGAAIETVNASGASFSNLTASAVNNSVARASHLVVAGDWGNDAFFGHGNPDYLSTLGHESNSGAATLCFFCYHSTAINTWRLSGATNAASRIQASPSTAAIHFDFAPAGTANTDIPTWTSGATITSTGIAAAQVSSAGMIITTGNAGLPASMSAPILTGGFGSPVAGRLFFGDGTGWKFKLSKRSASVTTDLFTFTDLGSFTFGAAEDVGVSRIAASTLAVGNGAAGDASGTLKLSALNNGGTLSLPVSTDTLVGRATADTLTNKTIDTAGANVIKVNGNTLSAAAGTGTVTIPAATDTLVGRATADTLTNKTFDAEAAGNTITLPFYVQVPAAGCNNATASPNWDLPPTNAPVANCLTGTNSQQGTADFDDTAARTMQTWLALPSGWTGSVDVDITWLVTAGGGANTVKFTVATACSASGATFDPAFNAANTITSGTVAANNALNITSQTAITTTGCAAGNILHIKFGRDNTDTSTATVRVLNVAFTIRRAM